MNTLHERLLHLLRTHNLTQSQLADKIDISRQTVSQIASGKLQKSRAIYKIADFFQVSINWLKNGVDPLGTSVEVYLGKFYRIPLFYNLNRNLLVDNRLILPEIFHQFELTRDPEYKNLFALVSSNNAMRAKFGEDAVLVFNTEIAPRNKDFVIVYLPKKNLFVSRELKIEDGKQTLLPIDADLYKPLYMPEDGFVVAVLYEKRLKRSSRTEG